MPRKLRLAPFALVLALVAAGCGSSGSSSSTGAAKLVAAADPICKQVSVARAAANTAVTSAGTSTSKTLQALARFAPPVAVDEHQAIVRLRTINAPAALSSDWQKLLSGMEQLANDTTAIGNDAKAGKYAVITTITTSARKLRDQLTEIATHDGFAYCGRSS
jgi:hypothetical protein